MSRPWASGSQQIITDLSNEVLNIHFGLGGAELWDPNFINFDLNDFREYSPVHHYIRDLNAGMPQHRFFSIFLTANFEGPQFCSPLS